MQTTFFRTSSLLSSTTRWLVAGFVVTVLSWSSLASSAAEQLRVESSPRRAKLYVNGVYKGRTPMMLVLDAGKYHLELRRSRYLTWATYTYLPSRTKMRLRVSLERVGSRSNTIARNDNRDDNDSNLGRPAPRDPNQLGTQRASGGGMIIVRSKPSGARVFRGGRLLGRTPLLATLTPGSHTLRFFLKGYATLTRTIEVSDKTNTNVKVNLSKGTASAAPQETSRMGVTNDGGGTQLVITSRPASAKVYLNGRLLGSTPVLTAGLAPGKYRLTLKRKGFSPYSRTFEMQAGQQLRFRILMVKKSN